MLKKPLRIYSDFANSRERAVVIALKKRNARQNIMANLDPNWDEERTIIEIRGRRATKEMAKRFLENVKKEDKLMAAYLRQLKARKAKSLKTVKKSTESKSSG